MIFEVPLSMAAWMGVVLIQAIVHFGIIGRRPRKRESEISLPPMDMSESSSETESEQEFPENFDKLLSQTGDEVIQDIMHSRSRLVRRAKQQSVDMKIRT
mmetsp:Transcript_768/g.922  ORF Transcript_768/g.922 Transcript_768/m.922 type:complete len:100 (+) Transcript_768:126-425(+)